MKDSPALSWAPVWVSVCLWAKLKDPSDSEQPERSTRRSSSPSRTSAKPWNHRERSWDDIEIKPTPHCKHHRSVSAHFSAWVSSETTSGSFLFSIYKHNNTISTETNNITREELKTLHYLSQHAQRHINGGHESPKRRSHIRVKSRSGETQHKQRPVLRKVHRLNTQRNVWFNAPAVNGECLYCVEVYLVQQYLTAVRCEVL